MSVWADADEAIVKAILDSGAFLVGLSGAQGSGKSSTAARVAGALRRRGGRTVVLSLDDFYLTKAERAVLAADVHPLLGVRGVPGTHDIGLAIRTLEALRAGERVRPPRFDKAADDRAAAERWSDVDEQSDVVILEGWCVGAAAQADAALAAPVNELEAGEDPDARWRTYVNAQLSNNYAALFAMLDLRVFLKAPGFHCVLDWRAEQERGLRGKAVMDRSALGRFIAHYERITRHMLDNPNADLVIELDGQRRPIRIEGRK
jgi:D-glycerate 3-kinase